MVVAMLRTVRIWQRGVRTGGERVRTRGRGGGDVIVRMRSVAVEGKGGGKEGGK